MVGMRPPEGSRMRRTIATLSVATLLTVTTAAPIGVAADPSTLAHLSTPGGVTVDREGNVWVASYAGTSSLLTAYEPDGELLHEVFFGDAVSAIGEGTALATDPDSGALVMLSDQGTIHAIDPATARIEPWLDLRSLRIDTSAVFDISSGVVSELGGLVIPSASFYGDLAIWRHDGVMDLFVSGNSVAIPFVLRVRLGDEGIVSARVLVASLASAAPNTNEPRGVAVTPDGAVLTVLPMLGAEDIGVLDHAIAFAGDLDERAGGSPRRVLDDQPFTSWGLAAGASGRFYAAIGSSSPIWCEAVPAVVIIEPDLATTKCLPAGLDLFDTPRDVAVAPDEATTTMVMQDSGAVVTLPT